MFRIWNTFWAGCDTPTVSAKQGFSKMGVRLCYNKCPMYQMTFISLGQLGGKLANRQIWGDMLEQKRYKGNNVILARQFTTNNAVT